MAGRFVWHLAPLVIGIGTLVVLFGLVAPWYQGETYVRVDVPYPNAFQAGLNGLTVIGLALLFVLSAILIAISRVRRDRRILGVMLTCLAAIALIAASRAVNYAHDPESVVEVGVGLWTTLIGILVVLAGSISLIAFPGRTSRP